MQLLMTPKPLPLYFPLSVWRFFRRKNRLKLQGKSHATIKGEKENYRENRGEDYVGNYGGNYWENNGGNYGGVYREECN